MPVYLAGDSGFHESATCSVHIGLINNMPDSALRATERQFFSLLDAASDGLEVRLSLYELPEVPRSETARRHLNQHYSSAEDLWDCHLDGLIVTGTEPKTQNLQDEPYWKALGTVIDWAEHNTHSTVWSCLAAHAALLHLDGIGRRRLAEKRFGVFECARASDDPLTAGVPAALRMPHSRWNDIVESELTDCGYSVLTRSRDGGVDAFTKCRKSLFVFFQGHPEYEANTLLLDYRRDIGRYLRCERDTYPPMPKGYFDQCTAELFAAFQERCLRDRRAELLADFPAAEAEKRISKTWHAASKKLYANWLTHLQEQRLRQSGRKYVQSAQEARLALSS